MPISVTPIYTNIWQGPARVFINVDLPASGARLPIDINGLPDTSTGQNANALWLGTTKAGSKFTATQDVATFEVDESPIPFRNTPTKESCQLEGDFAELLDMAKLLKLLPNSLHSTGVGPPAYDQITAGGLLTFTTMPVAMIGPTIADPTKFAVLQIYSAYSAGGLVMDIQRKQPNFSPFKFMGQGVSGRTAGDQLWTFWKQT